jgi:hypothetical protein
MIYLYKAQVGWYTWIVKKSKVKTSSTRKFQITFYFIRHNYIPSCWTLWQCKSHTKGPITPGSSPSMLPCLESCCTGFTITLPPPVSTGLTLIGSRTLARGSGMLAPLQDMEIRNSYVQRWFNTKFKLNIPSLWSPKKQNNTSKGNTTVCYNICTVRILQHLIKTFWQRLTFPAMLH